MNTENQAKAQALADHLGEDIIMIDGTDGENFSFRHTEYLVLTQEEAEQKASDYIRESLWAFRTEFIAAHTKKGLTDACIEALNQMQVELGEDCQPILDALIDDMDAFIKDAISVDGLAHFLATYDGEENEKNGYLIFRIN
jgi:hypothetical protein